MEPNKNDHKEWDALDHFHQKWNTLDGRAKEAASVLGYSQEEWDGGRVTHLLQNKNWADLDAPQKDAAKLLGFNEEKWARVANSVHKNHPAGVHEHEGEAAPEIMPSPFPSD